MDKFTIKAIIPDSSTIICGLMHTVSNWNLLLAICRYIPGYLFSFICFQMQSIRQEKRMENKNRNSFKSVQTLVMCISSSGYDIHKYTLIESQVSSPFLLVNI